MSADQHPLITLAHADVQRFYDMVVGSLDFGSGFLEDEDVELLRRIAVILGVDPMEATPAEWKRHYPHPYVGTRMFGGRVEELPFCATCIQPRAHQAHVAALNATGQLL